MITRNLIIHILQAEKILYVEIPKSGCTTIKYDIFWKRRFGSLLQYTKVHRLLNYMCTPTLEPFKDYFKFTVVRDPYTRFMSVYRTRIHSLKDRDFCSMIGIDKWPDEILNDPNKFIYQIDKEFLKKDAHTNLQTFLLPEDLSQLDYIGQIEDMQSVGKKLSQVLGEKIEFDHLAKSGFNNYPMQIDIDRFNYIFQDDYKTLKNFYSPLTKVGIDS